jgi:electron transfer flavoprotein beta subunit
MHIAVCIKQVPDTTDIKIDPETHTLVRESASAIINPFDTYAIEESLRIKEKLGGKITAVTMGPPQAENALREAVSMGVDEGILICDKAIAGSDTWATSYTLAKAVQKLGDCSLILCGKQASDGDTAQVGPGIAAHLGLPQITYVRKIEEISSQNIIAERLLENGYESIQSPLPCVLTVVKEINEPRLPSLKGKLKARKAEFEHWTAQDIEADSAKIGLDGSPTQVVKVFTPPPRGKGEILDGEPEEISEKLVQKIKEAVISASC